jgi:hypothetical protein
MANTAVANRPNRRLTPFITHLTAEMDHTAHSERSTSGNKRLTRLTPDSTTTTWFHRV